MLRKRASPSENPFQRTWVMVSDSSLDITCHMTDNDVARRIVFYDVSL